MLFDMNSGLRDVGLYTIVPKYKVQLATLILVKFTAFYVDLLSVDCYKIIML